MELLGIFRVNPHSATSIGDAGDLTSDGTWFHAWEFKNRLTSSSGAAFTTYNYDHTTQRVKKSAGSVTTRYANKYFDTDGTSPTRSIFTPGGELLATMAGASTTATSYIHGDHLGSANANTDDVGALTQVLDYYPYGAERIALGESANARHYIGERLDEETELNYLNARYYEGSRGQFISQDPVFLAIGNPGEVKQLTSQGQSSVLFDPQLLNSYSYAKGNPVRYKDPEGKYVEVSGSATIPWWSFSAGVRADANGVDFFMSGGPGVGAEVSPINVAWAPGQQLSHQREVSLTANGSASYIGGVKVSQDLVTYYPDTKSYQYGKSGDIAFTLGLSGGVGIGLEEEFSKPLYVRGNQYIQMQSHAPAMQSSMNVNRSSGNGSASYSGQSSGSRGSSLNSLLSSLSSVLRQISAVLSSRSSNK